MVIATSRPQAPPARAAAIAAAISCLGTEQPRPHVRFPSHRWKIGKPGEDSDEDIVVRVKADAQVAPS